MKGPIRALWAAAPLLLLRLYAHQPIYLNLDFETATNGRAWAWTCERGVYECLLDRSSAVSGAQSIRLRYPGTGPMASTVYQTFPPELVRGRHLKVSGYMKTEGITEGSAFLWIRVAGPATNLSLDFVPNMVTNGTTSWQRFTVERDVSSEARFIFIGGYHAGNGTAWFDGFSVEIDGAPYAEGPPPDLGEPSAAQLDWLRSAAAPLVTAAAASGFDDLAALTSVAANARIVGLGEGTHGTSEFFRMKHRILEYLATEMGFTIFAMEAGMAEAERINNYLATGQGDPKALLLSQGYWPWDAQEVLDMIIWMREFNKSGKGPLRFTGFDMQMTTQAEANVRSFAMYADPRYFYRLNEAYATVELVQRNYEHGVAQPASDVQAAIAAAQSVVDYLTSHRDEFRARFPARDVEWAIQNARIVKQAAAMIQGGSPYRDRAMAENIGWIAEQNPDARIVLWAHNLHVSRAADMMGSYLAEQFGAEYRVIGQVFHAGEYNALDVARKLGPNTAVESFPGSIEYVLHRADLPQFLLDLRKASETDPGSSWLFGRTLYRNQGSGVTDGFSFTWSLTKDYDALVFFDHTTPSALLSVP